MTHNKFVISDTHFGHEATCTRFKNKKGGKPLSFPPVIPQIFLINLTDVPFYIK